MKLKSIQFLRAIAVLLVVYAHSIDEVVHASHYPAFQTRFFYLENFGAIGVDIFFVISGFIMAYIIKNFKGPQDAVFFLKKRFIRIYPLYLLVNVPLFLFLHPGFRKIIRSITLIFLFDHGTGTRTYVLPVAWTLAYEMIFYFIVSIVIGISKGNVIRKCIIFLSGLILVGLIFHPADLRLQMLTNSIMLEFVFGLIIGWIYVNKLQISKWLLVSSFIVVMMWYLALIFLGYGLVSESQFIKDGSLSFKRVLIWGIPSTLLVFSIIFSESRAGISRIFDNKFMQLAGDASYSIYLIHTIFLDGVFYLFKNSFSRIAPDIAILLAFASSIFAGILVHKFIEKPLLALFRSLSFSLATFAIKKNDRILK